MASKIITEDLTSDDNEGVSIGSVSSYVSRFKEQEKNRGRDIPFNPKKPVQAESSQEERTPAKRARQSDPNALPSELTTENEKTVYVYYYNKFGNLDCDDFDKVKGKIASAINRLFNKQLSPDEALKKLNLHVSPADIVPEDDEETSIPTVTSKVVLQPRKEEPVKVDIQEDDYTFIKGLDPLTREQQDLCRFAEKGSICFSSDGYKFYLSVHPNHLDCFDKLFKFSAREEMVYLMFKEQLGDEHKAKKLVLMSRMLNDSTSDDVKEASIKEPASAPTASKRRSRGGVSGKPY